MSVTLDSRPGRAAVLASRAVVAGVFVWAAIPKILDPAQFAESIANYHLLPGAMVGPLAAGLPVLELVVAAALLLGVQARGAALVAIALLVVFAGGMAQAILRGIDLDCGCFGAATRAQVTWWSVARNAGLSAAACVVAVGPEVDLRGLFSRRKGAPPTQPLVP